MTTPEDRIHEWGIGFLKEVDNKVLASGNEQLQVMWLGGDFDYCYQWLQDTYPELTPEQFEWLEEFLSEQDDGE